jgi:hypothetical protein
MSHHVPGHPDCSWIRECYSVVMRIVFVINRRGCQLDFLASVNLMSRNFNNLLEI